MTAGSEKLTGYLPVFEKQQPFRRPRDDRRRDRQFWTPVGLFRVPKAERWPMERATVPVDVWKVLAVRHQRPDQRVNDMDGDVVVREVPPVEIPAPEVHDPDGVSLRCRPDLTFPNADPIGRSNRPEMREKAPNRGVLLIYG
jgi:hypothetical protein